MPEPRKICQYEVSVQKQLKKYEIVLWVSLNQGPRGKKTFLGEARTKDTLTPMIYFKVSKGNDKEQVYDNFLRLLVHRGYLPLKSREREAVMAQWSDWNTVPHKDLNVKKLLEQEKHPGN